MCGGLQPCCMGTPHLWQQGCPFVLGSATSLISLLSSFFSFKNSSKSICSYQSWWLMQQLLLGQNSWNHTAITHARSHARRRVVSPLFPIPGTKHSLTAQRARAAAQLAGAEMLTLTVKGWVTLWKLFRRVTLLVPFSPPATDPCGFIQCWSSAPAAARREHKGGFSGHEGSQWELQKDWSHAWLICWSPEKSFCLSWKHIVLATRLPFPLPFFLLFNSLDRSYLCGEK